MIIIPTHARRMIPSEHLSRQRGDRVINRISILFIGPLVGMFVVLSVLVLRDFLEALLGLTGSLYPQSVLETIEVYVYVHLNGSDVQNITTLAAFAVHLWLPLLVLCIGLLKALNYFRKAVGWTQWFVKGGKQHPLDAVGYVAAVLVFIATVVLQRIF
jgi:hypothetical protein